MSAMGIHPEGNNSFIFLFKQMPVARSMFTLDGAVQLFCAAFDMSVTGVALKFALGYKILFFGRFKNIIKETHLTPTWVILAF